MAGIVNINMDQGASYNMTLTVRGSTGSPTNLTGYTAYAQMRKSYYSSTAYDFTTGITAPSSGNISLSMGATSTSALSEGRYVYDVEIYNGSSTTRVIEGIVTVTPQVTKIP